MGYWKTKVLPSIKKVFETKTSVKKAAAADACKSFDESKESYDKEFEEKKSEYEVKVLELYESSSAEIKTLIKERKLSALKKYSAAVHKFLEELAKIEFPGSKPVSEASEKYGAAYVPGPVFYVFEKVSTYIKIEEKVEEPTPPAKAEEETSTSKEKEIVIEEEKKEEVVEEKKEEEEVVVAVEEKKEEAAEACVEEEKPKVEEPAKP